MSRLACRLKLSHPPNPVGHLAYVGETGQNATYVALGARWEDIHLGRIQQLLSKRLRGTDEEALFHQAPWSWSRTPAERDDDEEEDADFPIQGELISHWQRG